MNVRVLIFDATADLARREAREQYVALFVARYGVAPPAEWLERWWPEA